MKNIGYKENNDRQGLNPGLKILVLVFFLLFGWAGLMAESAEELLRAADDIFDIDQMYQKSTMTVVRNGRPQPVQTMESYMLNEGDEAKSLTVFLAPARVKGTAYLTMGDDLWVRFGSTGRVRKLSSSAKKNAAAGSDFSYTDMGEGNKGYTDDYTSRMDGSLVIEGDDCHRIILIPHDDDGYEKVVAYIQKDNLRYRRLELWEDGAHIKTMSLEDYREQDGLVYPYVIRMVSRTRDSETIVETSVLEVNSLRVDAGMFTQSYLRNIR
ncbi:MAG: outer membrane lipoprotein-sorting protein [Spirochaetales bacterium]|nr:outer membrane lipoprotein-sorting protein [Spirochaetales bacterium]